ncbi:MAG: hypothetical protein CVV53_08945 [Spirochaetae bacterium HGW-Spirochaetae-9]|nr:MAG: hypothetical protein CVV53_08945 [Spirochaetae bacterium HGW-Spirochaetae-9]
MKNAFLCLIFLLVCTGIMISCSFECIHIHTICLITPDRPEPWKDCGLLGYEIRWKDPEGVEHSASVAEGDGLIVDLKRGVRQAIIAVPHCGARELRAAGALYPFDLYDIPRTGIPSSNPDTMRLNFNAGYPAETARCIEAGGYDPWIYPLEKLASIRETRGRDPWSLPPWKAARSLLEGSFRLSAFPAAGYTLQLPPDRRWWPESPLCFIDFDGVTQTARLSEGIHVFFGEEEKLIAQVLGDKIEVQRTALQ